MQVVGSLLHRLVEEVVVLLDGEVLLKSLHSDSWLEHAPRLVSLLFDSLRLSRSLLVITPFSHVLLQGCLDVLVAPIEVGTSVSETWVLDPDHVLRLEPLVLYLIA